MKKMACILLALLLASSATAAALAATVSYQDGKVTVLQEEGLYQVVIDGVETGKFVGSLMPSLTFDYPLEEGREHLLVLLSLSGDSSIGAIESFWVGPTPEPTAAPTSAPTAEPTAVPTDEPTAVPDEPTAVPDEPTAVPDESTVVPTDEPTAEPAEEPAATDAPAPAVPDDTENAGPLTIENIFYIDRVLTLNISGLQGTGEILLDDADVLATVDQNGPFRLTKSLKVGNHTVTVRSTATGESVSVEFYARFFPDPDMLDPEFLGALLKDEKGAEIPYTVSYASDDHGGVLIITAEPEKEYLKLYLSDSLLANLRENSFDHLSLVSDSAELSIDLDAVGPSIFSTDKAIWYYIFTAARQSNSQYRVFVEAQTSVTDIVEAGFYSGITLIRDGVLTPVILNGIY